MTVGKKNSYKKIFASVALFLSACFSFAEIHTVQKGETYYSISRKYGVSLEELCNANNCTVNDVLKIGQTLTIPEKKSAQKSSSSSAEQKKSSAENSSSSKNSAERKFDTYTVQKGDTYYRIAKINGISVDELKKLNSLDSESVLKVGQKLKIPVTIVDTSAALPNLPESDPRKYSEKKGDSSLAWPVKNPTVTYMNGKVSGVQLSAQKNENVTAIRAGTVMYVGNYRGYGQVVFIQSKTGHIYVYSGLGSIKVRKGDYVVFGDSVGTAGTDSISGTNQMCLMVFQKASPIDPAKAPRG
jgi:LysM repeat protein